MNQLGVTAVSVMCTYGHLARKDGNYYFTSNPTEAVFLQTAHQALFEMLLLINARGFSDDPKVVKARIRIRQCFDFVTDFESEMFKNYSAMVRKYLAERN